MYCTVTVSLAVTAGPDPTMRSEDSSWVGGDPLGTTTVGSVPILPTGESQLGGIGAICEVCDETAAVVDTTEVVVDPRVEEVAGAGGPSLLAAVPEDSDCVGVELQALTKMASKAVKASNLTLLVFTSNLSSGS